MKRPIKKAVFPVAGLGTRFLPATKAVPKEMLPVVDRPVIQLAVDEAREAGCEHFVFVTGRNKGVIEDHFDKQFELEETLKRRGKTTELALLEQDLPSAGQTSFTRQQEPLGLGHAVWCARELVGNEPFALLLPDMLIQAKPGCLKQMMDVYQDTGGNVVAVEEVPQDQVSRYGVVKVGPGIARGFRIEGMVEKPALADAPSNLIISGRYILQPEIFDRLASQNPGAGGEIQLTDAMIQLMADDRFFGLKFEGQTYDCGDKVGFLAANVAYGLAREDLGPAFKRALKQIIAKTGGLEFMNFASDNVFGVHERIMNALVAANAGTTPSYGVDPYTREAEERLSALFERDVVSFLVTTGTAANALALSALVPPYGAVFAHADAHVVVDECGAPELFTGGAKMIGLAEPEGKISAAAIAKRLQGFIRGEHDPKPAAVSITQASELGTLYSPQEIASIAELCRQRGMRLHMDGARFANAVAALNCAPADITWRAGVDAMSFGCTKNGAMALEAVIFFDPALAVDFLYRRMRAGQLVSKSRFLGAQMIAYLEGDLWLANARHANQMARRVADGVTRIPQMRLAAEVAANEVFAIMPRTLADRLEPAAHFHEWPGMGSGLDEPGQDETLIRLVCSFRTTEEDVAKFLRLAREG